MHLVAKWFVSLISKSLFHLSSGLRFELIPLVVCDECLIIVYVKGVVLSLLNLHRVPCHHGSHMGCPIKH